MKIGYLMQAGVPDIFQRPNSGPATHVRQIFTELQCLGHEMCLLVLQNDGRLWKSTNFTALHPVSVCWMDRGPFRWFERAVRRLQYTFQLPYLALFESLRFAVACQQELAGFDLLYERMGWMGYGGSIAAQHLGVPLVLEVNGDHLSEFELLGLAPKGLQRTLSLRCTGWATKQAAHVVATGEGWRQKFIDRWHVEPSKVSVVENGSELVGLLERRQLRAFQGWGDDAKPIRVVYIGAFEPWHGILILLRAVAKACARGIQLQVELIGDGSELGNIRQIIDELDLAPVVTLTRYLDPRELAPRLAQADIGVSPYCGRVEYSGLKLLDYKAAGLVTIASGENGQPFVLEHGHTGWIVPPCDEDALAAALVHLSCEPELRKCIGQSARIEAEQMHSWGNTARQLDEIFTQLVGWRSSRMSESG